MTIYIIFRVYFLKLVQQSLQILWEMSDFWFLILWEMDNFDKLILWEMEFVLFLRLKIQWYCGRKIIQKKDLRPIATVETGE